MKLFPGGITGQTTGRKVPWMHDYQSVFARVEKKFLITEEQHAAITAALRLRGFAVQSFGSPTVQSLYYDTPDCLLVRRSIDRPNYKEKLRLRCYGEPEGGSAAYVEIKKKYAGVVYKRRTGLPLNDALSALRLGQMPESAGQIGREVTWFVQRWGVSPKALIIYERDAWLSAMEPELRVTFDRDIRFRDEDFDMTRPALGTSLIAANQRLMEVKIPGVWPMWLHSLLAGLGVPQTHFSKYGTAYLNYLAPSARLQPANSRIPA